MNYIGVQSITEDTGDMAGDCGGGVVPAVRHVHAASFPRRTGGKMCATHPGRDKVDAASFPFVRTLSRVMYVEAISLAGDCARECSGLEPGWLDFPSDRTV